MIKKLAFLVMCLTLSSVQAQKKPKRGGFEKSIRQDRISSSAGNQMFTVGSGAVKFSGLRFWKEVPAKPDSVDHCVPVTLNGNYKMSSGDSLKNPMVLFYADTVVMRLYINPKYFSVLNPCRAEEAYSAGIVGEVTNAFFEEGMTKRDVITVLMYAEIVRTYAHLYANVRLKSEIDENDTYEAKYKGTHHYCTNDCYDDDYRFECSLTKTKTGYSLLVM